MNMAADWNDLVLTAIVPVFNEEATLEAAVKRIRDVPLNIEIVAVTDGSTNASKDILDRLRDSGRIEQVIHLNYSGRTYEEGKKIDWRDGVAALWHVLRFNIFPPKRTLSDADKKQISADEVTGLK